jgi:hypothetical protein
MSSQVATDITGNAHEFSFNDIFFGGGDNAKMALKIVVGIIIAVVIIVILYFVIKAMSGFGNGRTVGSGCGRNNQLQRAVSFEFPISQTEYEQNEMIKQRAAGVQYANNYEPPYENVYAGFSDRKGGVDIEHFQVPPKFPQTGPNMPAFNDNVFKNIAYD